jgi:hypothetical protein
VKINFDNRFDYENGFYLSADTSRISKFATHLDLFRSTSGLPGEIIECGVFKGASLFRFIKFRDLFENCFSRKIIAFDIFGSFPKAQYVLDKKKRSQFIQEAGSKSIKSEYLISLLDKLNLNQNIELIEGNILQSVPEYLSNNPHLKISLLHIDVDLHEATKTCLENFYTHMVNGGIIVLDDYGAFAGANKAIDEFFSDKDISIEKLPYSSAVSFVTIKHNKKYNKNDK